MKKSILMSIMACGLFVVSQSFADSTCPNLSGAYVMGPFGSSTQVQAYQISQSTQGDVTTYTIKYDPVANVSTGTWSPRTQILVASNQVADSGNNDVVPGATAVVFCQDGTLVNRNRFGGGISDFIYSIDANGNLNTRDGIYEAGSPQELRPALVYRRLK